MNMKEHPLLQELLDDPRVETLSHHINELKESYIYHLELPDQAILNLEANKCANTMFVNKKNVNPLFESKNYDDRLVLSHPDGFRIRVYYASGYFEYHDLNRIFSGNTNLIDMKEADSIVQEFCSRYSLWPANSQQQIQAEKLRFVKSQGNSNRNETSKVIINNILVSYRRLTNGLSWLGPGSKIIAIIEGNDVVGFDRHWRDIGPKEEIKVQLLSVEGALEKMINRLSSSLDNKTLNKGDIFLEGIDFGYYAADRHTLQQFLQPVYMFTYRPISTVTTVSIVDIHLAHNESFENLLEYNQPEIQTRPSNRKALR
jgi:hypothetical protein